MLITTSLNKTAWSIRKEAALIHSCPVLDISWKHCIALAKSSFISDTKKKAKRAGRRINKKAINPLYKANRHNRTIKSPHIKRAGKRIDKLQPKCVAEISRVIKHFSLKHGVDIPMPEIIDFKKRGKVAGRCWNNRITLNWGLLKKNREKFIKRTPGHEAVHYVEFFLYGVASHDLRWKKMMMEVGLSPEKYHKYVTGKHVTKKSWRYLCDCSSHELTQVEYEKEQNRSTFWCSKCKTTLVLEGRI